MTVAVACIVEGHGEVQALPVLLRRLAVEIAPDVYLDIEHPILVKEATIKQKPEELKRYVVLAAEKVRAKGPGFVLLLTDADDDGDCPARLGPHLQALLAEFRPDVPGSVVLAKREFEAWFLAAADSLAGKRGLPETLVPPADPEAIRGAKEWLDARMTEKYRETRDQPAFAATFDLQRARANAPSFDKLWREVEKQIAGLLGRPGR